jgi:hypothetical protein
MQNGKAGSYFWARAGPAAETDAIAKIAKAKRRIGIFLTIDGTASAQPNRPAMLIPVNSRSRGPSSAQLPLTCPALAGERGGPPVTPRQRK